MKPPEVKDAMAQIARLWPRADWPDEVKAEFARRLAALPIDAAQCSAALVNLRMGWRFQTVQPVEVWDALTRATGRADAGPVDHRPTPSELAELKAMKESGYFHALACEWLRAQDARFAHWLPEWLGETGEVHKWVWGRRFLAWARGRWRVAGEDNALRDFGGAA